MQDNIQTFIDQVRASEGPSFEVDEAKVKEEMREYQATDAHISVKLLSVLGGIFATAAFMGFLMLTGVYESKTVLVASGLVFIGASVLMNNRYDHLLLDTFTITLYVMGFVLLALGLGEWEVQENFIIASFLVLAVLSLIFAQNYMLTLVAVLIFSGSLAACFAVNDLENLILILYAFFGAGLIILTTQEARIISTSARYNRLYQPLQLGFFISLVAVLFFLALDGKFSVQIKYLWAYAALAWLATSWMVWKVMKSQEVTESKHQLQVFVLMVLLLIPSLFAPYIAGAIFLVILTYYYGFRTQFYLSIAFLVYAFSQYYYDLNLTLLAKSGILFSSGLLLILGRFIFNKQLKSDE